MCHLESNEYLDVTEEQVDGEHVALEGHSPIRPSIVTPYHAKYIEQDYNQIYP